MFSELSEIIGPRTTTQPWSHSSLVALADLQIVLAEGGPSVGDDQLDGPVIDTSLRAYSMARIVRIQPVGQELPVRCHVDEHADLDGFERVALGRRPRVGG